MELAEARVETKPVKMRSMKRGKRIERIVIYALLIILSIVFIFPFFWLVGTSLKPESEAMAFPPSLLPKKWDWANYKEVFEIVPFAKYYINSLIVTVGGVIGTVISCTIVAYGFARIKGKGRDFWFAVLLATMMLPPQVTMIPVYMIFSKLGWINTFLPLIVPSFFGNAYYIFLLRQFFKTIPRELEESAYLDGCGTFGIFWRIIIPLSIPSVITVALLSFMGYWNDFLGPLIYLNDESKYTLALGILQFKGALIVSWGPMMAASVLVLLPLIILFFVGQKYFISGIATTGVKG
ncbi:MULTISPECIES: carbohydrate ABC transporter permease [Anoxybacillaceae]|uniref:Putative ABC transporter permease protein n=1 Tax=Parageobacillus caldoxylosilyticus NBRC 107762 TaxID=1220594 RepID=A0A023DF57_9BACL|nr:MULTISPECIES: carbohydrate ABC transporter permease [Bacillaceae]MED4971849.1 carbohydrate ABC transporter permease [Geobacillus thermoleovorans]WJQ02267.1 carbohydrate ABC transporter permease [Geobacillus stearothermophilus]BDG34298.1 sugar ABC transporter permease [Parageobacillus caldoxylosilyticus]BDG38067.1 sugar ABC transporter permease [Parageobacillus caldoxylosilyticus]BDG41846.1 sugar ABC transporter permease [Parageobacillus caldoxylosilyticus]